MLTKSQTKASIDAFMTLLMTRSYGAITMRDVAREAKVPLAGLLMSFSGKDDLIAGYAAGIDAAVLEGDDPDMSEEPARERLFDVLMRRYDTLLPDKLALIQLERDARGDPALSLFLAQTASRSMRRMAASADVDLDGPRGALVLAGLLALHRRVLQVWLSEEDAGQARTMAELDKALRQAERRIGDLDRVIGLVQGRSVPGEGPLCRLRAMMGRQRNAAASEGAEAA